MKRGKIMQVPGIMLLLMVCLHVPAQTGTFLATGIGGQGNDILNHLVLLKDGWLITGSFQDSLVLGQEKLASAGLSDGFIARMDLQGNTRWTHRIGGKYHDNIVAAVAIPTGNVIVFGYFRDAPGGYLPYFIKTIDSAGRTIQVNSIDPRNRLDNNRLIAVNKDQVYLTGSFSDSLYLNGQIFQSKGKRDIFLARLDSSGSVTWVRTFGGKGDDLLKTAVISQDRKIILGGSIDAGMITRTGMFNPGRTSDILLLKYDPMGVLEQTKSFRGEGDAEIEALAVDHEGNIYATGAFDRDGFSLISYGHRDIFIVKFDKEGQTRWVRQIGGRSRDEDPRIVMNDNGNIYISVVCKSNCFFNEEKAGTIAGSLDFRDAGNALVLAGYDSLGSLKSYRSFPCSSEAVNKELFLLPDGRLLAAGTFHGKLFIQGNPDSVALRSNGGKDIFILTVTDSCDRFRPGIVKQTNMDQPLSVLLDAGEGYLQYNWNDSLSGTRFLEVSHPGIYKVTVLNEQGCIGTDSVRINEQKLFLHPDQNQGNGKILIIPNPTTGKLTVQVTGSENKIRAMMLYSRSGDLLEKKEMPGITQFLMDLSARPPGIYFLSVITDEETISKSIIKL